MIEDLPPDLRALVSASRSRLAPDPATVARLHASVHAAAAGGVAVGASAVIAKLAVVVAVATVGTVAYVRHTPSRAAIAPTITVASSTTARDDETEVAPRIVAVEREPAPRPALVPEIVAPMVPVPAAPPPPPPPSLARETELLDQASQALHRGDHAAVLAAIATYDLETSGHGQLAEDAAAIALEAACASSNPGDPGAATKLAAFTHRWPHSAQHTRLAAVCHEGDSR